VLRWNSSGLFALEYWLVVGGRVDLLQALVGGFACVSALRNTGLSPVALSCSGKSWQSNTSVKRQRGHTHAHRHSNQANHQIKPNRFANTIPEHSGHDSRLTFASFGCLTPPTYCNTAIIDCQPHFRLQGDDCLPFGVVLVHAIRLESYNLRFVLLLSEAEGCVEIRLHQRC